MTYIIRFGRKYYAYICMALLFAALMWRAFRGFCWSDESFYISTADRFYRGVVPLVGEWYRTQMSSLIMVPFYAAFIKITGGINGVVLYFRLLYLLLSTCAAIMLFRVLRKDHPDHIALISASFTMCYAHLNNATFSYYMLSYVFLLIALILIYDHKNSGSKGRLVSAGLMIALSVFCMPFFAAGYFAVMAVVIAAVIAGKVSKKGSRIKTTVSALKLWDITLYTIIGIAIPAVIFCVWLLMRTDIMTLMKTLPYALIDKEHSETLGYYIRKPGRCLTEVFGSYTYMAYALCIGTFLLQRFIKKHPFRDIIIFADAVLFVLMTSRAMGYTGYIQVVLFICMIPVFFVSDKKDRDLRLFVLFVIPSALVALIYCFASSDFLYVMAIGCALGSSVAPCILYDLTKSDTKEDKARALTNVSKALLLVICIFTAGTTFVLRMKNVYRDAPIPKLTEKISFGVAKGLYTTSEHLDQYTEVYEVIDRYCTNTDDYEIVSGNPRGNVLFSKILPWGYIVSSMDCGYPTTWRATAYDKDQLDHYYEQNPDSVPDIMIVLDTEIGSYDAAGDTEDDHDPNLDEMSDYWKDYIAKNGFTYARYKCATIYGRTKGK